MVGVAFSPIGQTLASASDDNTVRLWDLATGELRFRLAEHTRSGQLREVQPGRPPTRLGE